MEEKNVQNSIEDVYFMEKWFPEKNGNWKKTEIFAKLFLSQKESQYLEEKTWTEEEWTEKYHKIGDNLQNYPNETFLPKIAPFQRIQSKNSAFLQSHLAEIERKFTQEFS